MNTEAEAPAPPAPSPNGSEARKTEPREGTTYVILERVEAKDDGTAAWRPVEEQSSAAGAEAAIKQAVGDREGAFKAVPFRSWKGGLTLGQETRKVTVAKALED